MVYLLYIILGCVVLAVLLAAFMRLYPPFGGRLQGARRMRVTRSPNHGPHVFANQIDTPMDLGLRIFISILRRQLKGRANRYPPKPLAPAKPTSAAYTAAAGTYVTWLGHSTCLVRIGGKTLVFDPIFSKRASPFQSIGPKRFTGTPVLGVDQLPPIDAVVISHDHYDHLDYHTIKRLAKTTARFFVPLGVGAHLERWGIGHERISELDWWQQASLANLTFVCTPARHFSGRSLNDRSKTLWASWVIRSRSAAIYFSGDGGYGPHFKAIGEAYGPFDLTMLECGQYDKHWQHIHMTPEDTVQAHQDLGGTYMLPIHWGTFTLAFHTWTDSVERAIAAAKPKGVSVITPALGQTFLVGDPEMSGQRWWQDRL